MSQDSPGRGGAVRDAVDITHPGGMRGIRVLPTDRQDHLDPFVVFERFFIDPNQGFDTHPHRGFEIVSYLLEGGMAHEDSMGHSHVARTGDVMRITTGRGMRHSELPAENAACNGLQLWVNLPRAKKEIEPGYQAVSADALPVTQIDGTTITTIVGDGSPVELHTAIQYYDVTVAAEWTWTLPDDWNGFLYGIDGHGNVNEFAMERGQFYTVSGTDTPIRVTSDDDHLFRVAAIAGQPHGEPIRQQGPFVD